MTNICIFASGGGSNFKAIFKQILEGKISGKIVLVISNNPGCDAIKFANSCSIKILIVNKYRFPISSEREKIILESLIYSKIDLICLAGYMKMLSVNIIKSYQNKILNIHPALLPEFGGRGFFGIRVHEAVIKSQNKFSGATVHFVDEVYDHGPIILQRKININNNENPESLAKRILEIEHQIFPEVVKAFCENRIIIKNNQIKIMEYNEN